MYPKYSSKSIIIKRANSKDDDQLFLVYSDRFGLIFARAVSVRREGAKLKNNLSKAIVANLTLIRSKAGWKIVEADMPSIAADNFDTISLRVIYKVLGFFVKIVPINSNDPSYFDILYKFLLYVDSGRDVKELEFATLHDLLVRYGGINSNFVALSNLDNLDKEKLRKSINKAMQFIK